MTNNQLDSHKTRILSETKNVSSFVVIGETLHKLYYEDKLVKNQREFLEWTRRNLGFSKSTTYEYIISYRVYSSIVSKIPPSIRPPMYQSHCQLLAKIPEEKLADVWIQVSEQAPNGIITTGFLENFLIEHNLLMMRKSPKERINNKKKRRLSAGKKKLQASDSETEISDVSPSEFDSFPPTPMIITPHTPISHTPTNHNPDVLAAAADIMDLMERTPPKKRAKHRNLFMEHDEDPSHTNLLSSLSPGRTFSALPALLSPLKNNPSPLRSIVPHSNLPFNESLVYELARNQGIAHQFDFLAHSVRDFMQMENESWYGRVYFNLSECLPFSTCASLQISQYGGIERLLQIIFTRFANKDFSEGFCLIRAEFGADWFTPILQHPHVILRHLPNLVIEGAFHSYVLFYMGHNQKEFCDAFRTVGTVPGYNAWAPLLTIPNLELIHEDSPRKQPLAPDMNSAASALCRMTTLTES